MAPALSNLSFSLPLYSSNKPRNHCHFPFIKPRHNLINNRFFKCKNNSRAMAENRGNLDHLQRAAKPDRKRVAPVAPTDIPLLSCLQAIERLKQNRENNRGKQRFLAMYSSIFDGIVTDEAAMVIPMDDHMVHERHGVFDTAAIMNEHLYELDQHADRIVSSAAMAIIVLPFYRESIRRVLIQTVSA